MYDRVDHVHRAEEVDMTLWLDIEIETSSSDAKHRVEVGRISEYGGVKHKGKE